MGLGDKVEKQRLDFVEAYMCGAVSMAELCARYNVSRKTGYKWYNRFLQEGFEGLKKPFNSAL